MLVVFHQPLAETCTNTHVTTVIVHKGGVVEALSVVSWNTLALDWCDKSDPLRSHSLNSVKEKYQQLTAVKY